MNGPSGALAVEALRLAIKLAPEVVKHVVAPGWTLKISLAYWIMVNILVLLIILDRS